MTAEEVRGLSDAELSQKLGALRTQLFQLRVQAKLGRLERGLQLRSVRRDIARCLTVHRQRQIGGSARRQEVVG